MGTTDMVSNLVPSTKYQSYITGGGSINCNGVLCDVTVAPVGAGAHGLANGELARITNTGIAGADTPTGSGDVVTVISATRFTYPRAVTGSGVVGQATWLPTAITGGTFSDAQHSTTLVRLVNTELASQSFKINYGARQWLSPDGAKLLRRLINQNQWQVLDFPAGTQFRTTAQIAAVSPNPGASGSELGWGPDSNTLYYFSGNTLRSLNLTTMVASLVHTFTTCTTAINGFGGTGDWDDSRTQATITCPSTVSGNDFFVYDALNDVEGTHYNQAPTADYPFITEQVSSDGVRKNFVINNFTDGAGATQGTWLVNGATGVQISQITQQTAHSIPGFDGTKYWWMSELTDPACGTGNGLVSINMLNTSEKACLINATNTGGRGVYFKSRSSTGAAPGWVVISIFDTRGSATSTAAPPASLRPDWATAWPRYYNELFECRMDGTQCYRLGFVWARTGDQVYVWASADGKVAGSNSTINAICYNAPTPCPISGSGIVQETLYIQTRP
ncbi:MAG: hypothetical protein L0099_17290 [Acidobacteria bacterium]|nr:hypothetical protein [Acidobacteriota bacterium]